MRLVLVATAALTATLAVRVFVLRSDQPAHAPLAIDDIVAFRRAVTHGAAVERGRATEAACKRARALRYLDFGTLFDHSYVAPGVAFGGRIVGLDVVAESSFDNISVGTWGGWMVTSDMFKTSRDPIIDELGVSVASDDSFECHAVDDWAIECPRQCHDDPLEACNELHRRLDRAWYVSPRAIWRDGFRGVRARLTIGWGPSCDLVFDRHVDEPHWIGNALDSEIPLGLVGRPAQWLHPRRDTWTAAATGDDIEPMTVEAIVEHGVITEIRASGYQSKAGFAELQELTRDLPVKVSRDDDGVVFIRVPG